MRHLVSHEPSHRPVADVMGAPEVRGGITFRESLPPGPERDAAIERNIADAARRAAPLDARAADLRDLVVGHEPKGLILGIAIPGALGTAAGDDAPTTLMWNAQVEHLVGLAVSAPPGAIEAPTQVIRRAGRLLRDVFGAAHAKYMSDAFEMQRSGNDPLDATIFLLRGEHLFDRMNGYATHLARMDAEVFDRHRDQYVSVIGFNPADVHRVVRAWQMHGNEALNAARDRYAEARGVDDEAAATAVGEMVGSVERSRIWVPDDVAATTGIDPVEVIAMLSCFSTGFDAQPDYLVPTDPNVIRSQPAIDLGDGTFLVADAWALTAAVHLRLSDLAHAGGGSFPRYRKHREDGHQRVVTGAFAAVFGDKVVESQHYTSVADGPGEIDTLVCGSWPVITEAKAHGLTPPGRRGAPGRVERVARDVLEESFSQTARAHRYVIEESGRVFARAEGADLVTLLPDAVDGATDVVVTFERMDPLALHAQGLAGEPGRPVWVVSAADLLMVVDVLDSPAALHHYIRTRAATSAASVAIYVESDGLGGYLIDRLSSQLALAAQNPNANLMLGYTSGAINEHFTLAELGQPTAPLVTGVPQAVADALQSAFHAEAPGWMPVVDAVMGADLGAWTKWQRFCRRHRSKGRFDLTPSVTLVPGSSPVLVPTGDGWDLHVPT